MPKVNISTSELNMQVGVNDLKKVILILLKSYLGKSKNTFQDNNARRSIIGMAKFIFIIDKEIDTFEYGSRALYYAVFKPLAEFYSDNNRGNRRGNRYTLNLTEAQISFFAALSVAINIYPLKKIDLTEEGAPVSVDMFCREFVANFKKVYSNAIAIVRDRREEEFEKNIDKEKGKFKIENNTGDDIDKKYSDINNELENTLLIEIDYIYDDFIPIVIGAFKKHYLLDAKYTNMELALKQILKKVKNVDIIYKSLIFQELEKPLEIMLSKLNNIKTEEDILREFFYNREMPDIDFSKLVVKKRQADDSE